MPLVDIVTGTYQRKDHLQRMIKSVRDQMPRHLPARFIVVDGGSTDGTIEWCEQQSDIVFVGHGELKGAIKAFCDGAMLSDADYTILANDDIEFHPNSILRAVAYLEEHRTCGAVGFADNRFAQVTHENPHQYRVMNMPAIDLQGKMTSVNYAQVGMFRNWLGHKIGWWGCRDDMMKKARTYAADNWASAAVWELGYSVDAVAGCAIDDFIPPDAMRAQNVSTGSRDSAQYYARFPRGPRLQPYPQVHNPDRERLRVIVMDIHEPALPARLAKEQGLAEAFAEIGLVYHIDQINDDYDLVALVRAWQPHLLVVQLHDTDRITPDLLKAAQAEKHDMVIASFNGDAHERGLIGADVLEMLKHVDLHTVVNAKVLSVYKRKGIRGAYWQLGYKPHASPYEGEVNAHDVLLQMNCYDDRRKALVAAIRAIRINKRKPNVGVYGSCEGSITSTHYDFAHQAALYANAKITVGDTFPDTLAFVSNRMLQALGNGAFYLQEHSEQLDQYNGWQAGIHYIEWFDLRDLATKIKYWLHPDQDEARHEIARAGRDYITQHMTYPHQVEKLIHELL